MEASAFLCRFRDPCVKDPAHLQVGAALAIASHDLERATSSSSMTSHTTASIVAFADVNWSGVHQLSWNVTFSEDLGQIQDTSAVHHHQGALPANRSPSLRGMSVCGGERLEFGTHIHEPPIPVPLLAGLSRARSNL